MSQGVTCSVAALAHGVAGGDLAGARTRTVIAIRRLAAAVPRDPSMRHGAWHVCPALVELGGDREEGGLRLLVHPVVEERALLCVGHRRERDEPDGRQSE